MSRQRCEFQMPMGGICHRLPGHASPHLSAHSALARNRRRRERLVRPRCLAQMATGVCGRYQGHLWDHRSEQAMADRNFRRKLAA